MVFSDKGNKNDRLQDAESSTCRVSDSDPFVEQICQRLQDAVNHDPQERKGQLVFLVEFFSISFLFSLNLDDSLCVMRFHQDGVCTAHFLPIIATKNAAHPNSMDCTASERLAS